MKSNTVRKSFATPKFVKPSVPLHTVYVVGSGRASTIPKTAYGKRIADAVTALATAGWDVGLAERVVRWRAAHGKPLLLGVVP